MDFGDGHNFLGQNLSSSLNPKHKSSLNEVSCQCAERMKDEQLLLQSELHAITIVTLAAAQRAARAALQVFTRAVDKALPI